MFYRCAARAGADVPLEGLTRPLPSGNVALVEKYGWTRFWHFMRVANRRSITSAAIEFIQPAKSEHSELVYTPAILAIGETFADGPVSHLNTSTTVSVSWDLLQPS